MALFLNGQIQDGGQNITNYLKTGQGRLVFEWF